MDEGLHDSVRQLRHSHEQVLDRLVVIANNQLHITETLHHLADAMGNIEEAIYELSKPKRIVRDESGKITGIESKGD